MAGIRIKHTVRHLHKGGLIIFGTDTVNGIGCLVSSTEAMEKIFEIKNRDRDKPLILLMSDHEMVKKYLVTDTVADRLINAYMPGKLTMLLYAKHNSSQYTIKEKKTAFRIPGRKSLRELIRSADKPIASTSLNISGKDTIVSRREIMELFPEIPIFNNLTNGSKASTIIDATDGKINYIRKGEITIRGYNGKD